MKASVLFALALAACAPQLVSGSRYRQARKGIPCAVCKDTVED